MSILTDASNNVSLLGAYGKQVVGQSIAYTSNAAKNFFQLATNNPEQADQYIAQGNAELNRTTNFRNVLGQISVTLQNADTSLIEKFLGIRIL